MSALLAAAASLIAAAVLTAFVLRRANHHGILDVPNHRSSHDRVVPRGGGLAIVAVALGGAVLAAPLASTPRVWAALACGVAVAGVGLVDDISTLSAKSRLVGHVVSAAALVALLPPPGPDGDGATAVLRGVLAVLAVVTVVWSINLYNFMDGIDGLAGGHAVVVFGAMAFALHRAGGDDGSIAAAALAGAAGGFVLWNLPPARIFLGDVGSGYLGFAVAALALVGGRLDPWLLLVAVLCHVTFIVDATATLLRRMIGGDAWHQPHRSHAYQRIAHARRSHGTATLLVLALDAIAATVAVALADRPAALVGGTAAVSLTVLCGWGVTGRMTRASTPAGG